MKISIIIPTYNDSISVLETLESVKSQTYPNYDVIIVDDGSTDDTYKVIRSYLRTNKLSWSLLQQENSDQLNAIKFAISHKQAELGDLIFILHSDDMLPEKNFFKKAMQYIEEHPQYDAYSGSLQTIDRRGNRLGSQDIADMSSQSTSFILTRTAQYLGRNLYVDFAFFRKKTFLSSIYQSYLTWNIPFWLSLTQPLGVLKVKKMPFPILKYRIHPDNYHTNYKGQLNIISGELRTALYIMAEYHIPAYRFQFLCYRAFRKLHLSSHYHPIYSRRRQTHLAKVVEFIVAQRFGSCYTYDLFLRSLVSFFANYRQRTIKLEFPPQLKIYQGSDVNRFNSENLLGSLDPFYKNFFAQMSEGFNQIIVGKQSDLLKAQELLKFCCIEPYVKLRIRQS